MRHDKSAGAPNAAETAGSGQDQLSDDLESGPATSELDALHALADLSGQSLGPYRVDARVGGGAMAAVYRAYDQTADQPVALKVLLPGADRVARERFRREAELVSGLHHPNIVPTYHIGQTSVHGSVYIAMELVDGPSLADVLDQVGRLEPLDAARLLAPIARALDYAHASGVVHRDVKPSNILLRRSTNGDGIRIAALPDPVMPLLTDFGIARALDAPELTSAGRTIGTPAFMAPEQCAGEAEIDGRADVYALGAVLYRCLVGRPPFGGTTTQILHAHVYDPVLIPEDVALRVPPLVLGALSRALMKEPAKRYASAGLLAQELETFTQSGGVAPSADSDGADATMTMLALPVATPTTQTSRVLVPAPPVTPTRGVPTTPRPPTTAADRLRPRTPLSAKALPRQPRRNRAGVLILGGALALLLVALVAMFVLNALPSDPPGTVKTPAAGGTPTAQAVTVGLGTPSPGVAVTDAAGSQTPPPPTPSLSGPVPTPTPVPTLVVDLASAWDDAQALYADRDWRSALDWLTAVRRRDPSYERERVEQMMVRAYVALASDAIAHREWQAALDLLDDALGIRPDAENVLALRAAVAAVIDAGDDGRLPATLALQTVMADDAEALAAEGNPCAAADEMNVALFLQASVELVNRLAELGAECLEADDATTLAELSGAIVYSAQEGDVYRVFRLPVTPDAVSTLLVDNAAQPRVSPNERVLAYYNRTPGNIGLSSLTLGAGAAQSVRLTEFAEDAADAPPSWSPQGDRLVYTSNTSDGRYRIYMVGADGTRASTALGFGKDPAWNPQQDQIVYNGMDETGNRPGLWLMQANGESPVRLTDNGNDQRPAWTPDGASVVFMSSGRDGNWEIYRLELADSTLTRLTDDPAQDGLPAMSPDGRYVAFMSDRGGFWRLWYVPIEGGEAKLLGTIAGSLRSWLEHAIQWVN
jgi:serine/threonine protein kinase